MGYLMPKTPLQKDSSGTILHMNEVEDKAVHTFSKGISQKVNWSSNLFTTMSQSCTLATRIYIYIYIYICCKKQRPGYDTKLHPVVRL